MYTNITDIATALNLDPKVVAQIYKEWFIKWLNKRDKELKSVGEEINNLIY